ncbi:ATP-binding protein, partial [Planktothrix agardhii 1033]|nr:ATP-binding protein [Planktothrix agardhii 1033]
MTETTKSVPRLNLEPKLDRPLSLLNPLDYLRLLYWVFFFPQALRWYLDKFYISSVLEIFEDPDIINWRKIRNFLLTENLIWLKFLIQCIFLAIGFPFLFIYIGNYLNIVNINISILILFFISFFIGTGFFTTSLLEEKIKEEKIKKESEAIILFISLILGVCIAFGWIIIPIYILLKKVVSDSLLVLLKKSLEDQDFLLSIMVLFIIGIILGLSAGLILGVVVSVSIELFSGIIGISVGIAGLILIAIFTLLLIPAIIIIIFMITNGLKLKDNYLLLLILLLIFIVGGFGFSLGFSVTWELILTRPENWFLGVCDRITKNKNKFKNLPHVTPIPIPSLSINIKKWVLIDWEIGLHNINQLLKYTLQFKPVLYALNQAFIEIPEEQVFFRINQLAIVIYDRHVVRFLSEDLNITTTKNVFKPRLDVPYRAVAAGFWYLYTKDSEKATDAFTLVSSLLYGQEMLTLAQILMILTEHKKIDMLITLELPDFPPEPYLRPQSWTAIKTLYQVIEDFNLIKNSVSLSTRSLALNRVLGEIKKILDQSKTLPEAEQGLIIDIAQNWQSALLGITEEIGKISITEKVINPYIIGDPVIGKQFIGREDIIKQLEELWILTPQLQSVVLFGHRRMGKTSILRNISTRLDEKVKLAYVNLLTVGNSIQGVGEVLMAIADSLSDTLQIPPPDDESLINLPYRTFERYLKQIETQLGDTGLIIALDEFEQIEELIKSDRIPKDFMGVLRGMVQMSPKIAFALAGLHTLEEMTEDYFNPFFASIIPIRVSFLERATCRYLLANPGEDFPLDYKPDALDYIYDLTAGQPYLVQLIGFLLVRRYNDQVFELGNKRDPMFTIADVDGIINQPEFYQNGRYYFTGVWQQAGEGSPGQQQIIKAIAP